MADPSCKYSFLCYGDSPTMKVLSLLLHSYNFNIIMNHNLHICVFQWS
ncbi:mCG1050974 [Mus musculus]|nr:mCG1050974 [Mus musculus]